jgi:hypothetical protein
MLYCGDILMMQAQQMALYSIGIKQQQLQTLVLVKLEVIVVVLVVLLNLQCLQQMRMEIVKQMCLRL